MTWCSIMRKRDYIVVLILAMSCAACGRDDKPSPESVKPEFESKPTVHVPPPVEHYVGTPLWLTKSPEWPAVMEWTLGPDGEYTHDSLVLRLSGAALQSFVAGPKAKHHPIMCWLELTVRPIPKQLVGNSFNIDSVVFFDPIKKKRMPALPMLSSERHSERGVVRTRFSNNMVVIHSPELEEGQPLEPTVFMTSVQKKTLKITMAPINVSFVTEIKPEVIPADSLKWGPS